MKFCLVEGSVAWYKNRYQESTEAPVVGSDLNNLNLSLLVDDVSEPGDLVIAPLRHDTPS
jgi:hypothetical protein